MPIEKNITLIPTKEVLTILSVNFNMQEEGTCHIIYSKNQISENGIIINSERKVVLLKDY